MPEFYDIEPSLMGGMRAPSANFYIREEPDDEEPDDEEADEEAVSLSNAALIAAAPELLAALDELLRVTVDAMLADGFTLTDEEQVARDQALAVIARATGSASC